MVLYLERMLNKVSFLSLVPVAFLFGSRLYEALLNVQLPSKFAEKATFRTCIREVSTSRLGP